MCGEGRHCHAGIPQQGLYQLSCKVAFHISQSAFRKGGSGFCVEVIPRRGKGRRVCKYEVRVLSLFVRLVSPFEYVTTAHTHTRSNRFLSAVDGMFVHNKGRSINVRQALTFYVLNMFVWNSKPVVVFFP